MLFGRYSQTASVGCSMLPRCSWAVHSFVGHKRCARACMNTPAQVRFQAEPQKSLCCVHGNKACPDLQEVTFVRIDQAIGVSEDAESSRMTAGPLTTCAPSVLKSGLKPMATSEQCLRWRLLGTLLGFLPRLPAQLLLLLDGDSPAKFLGLVLDEGFERTLASCRRSFTAGLVDFRVLHFIGARNNLGRQER